MKIEHTPSPTNQDIDFLTQKINEESRKIGITEEAYPFAFFIRDKTKEIIAGCNGSVIYGTIYTDQLWVNTDFRGQGLGRQLMEQVHIYGRKTGCYMATVNTMSFQRTRSFYEHLGYECDFERSSHSQESNCFFLKKMI